ncbi:hypothetical protein [Streptomyces venetus]|uniref:hypothetical protein n=1 Tax=Streptomyces venetus TaxID=1701086 RepID=UPI003C2D02BF
MGPVKRAGVAVREPSTDDRIRPRSGFLEESVALRNPLQESAMADLAFVVTTIALFALVVFVAKGVTKL